MMVVGRKVIECEVEGRKVKGGAKVPALLRLPTSGARVAVSLLAFDDTVDRPGGAEVRVIKATLTVEL